MPRKLIQTQWGVFSKNFAKFHRLPFGTDLRLFNSAGKKKRSDFKVKRQRLNSKTMLRIGDNENVRFLLDSALTLMSTDLNARRLNLELFNPNGEFVNGNTLVQTLREMDSLPTDDDIEQMHIDELLIDEMESIAHSTIVDSEYLVDDPSVTVCSGFVRALVERYGRQSVIESLGQ